MAINTQGDPNDMIEGTSGTGRTEAFSDGVFAIAMTLLVLEIRVPHVEEPGTLLNVLIQQWPTYLAFLLSFVFILIMWANHHRMFNYIKRSNFTFMLLNGFLLMGITLLPFPTSLMSEYLGHPDETVAALVFTGMFSAIAIFFNVVWHYAVRNGLLDESLDPSFALNISRQYVFGPIVYFASFVVAFFSVPLSLVIVAGLAVFFALPPSLVRRLLGRSDNA